MARAARFRRTVMASKIWFVSAGAILSWYSKSIRDTDSTAAVIMCGVRPATPATSTEMYSSGVLRPVWRAGQDNGDGVISLCSSAER